MNKPLLALSIAISMALFGAATVHAADIVPVNLDDPGEGYNDPTAAAPVGGNPGTTVGQQRRIVAQFAADLWGSVLVSDVPVYVGAQFNPLAPNVLGSAGATFVFTNFAAGIEADTWYSSALADAIGGVDLAPGELDINSQFSSDFTFYFGLDDNTPVGQVNFLDVIMHEIGHGLGFQNFENETAGTFFNGTQDIYSVFTYDNTTGKFWTEMTIPERQASALNYGNVVFTGTNATAGAALILDDSTDFLITAPGGIAGSYAYGTASFGPAPTVGNFTGEVVAATDDITAPGPSTTDACTAITNPGDIAGKIALVDRGGCGFTVKAANVQAAGATGMIVADNVAGNPPPGLGGTDPAITIPAIRVTQTVGATIRSNLPGVTVTFVTDPTKLQGADNAGRPRLYMPDPVQGGSSGSHYDTALSPNALMEPAINGSLFAAINIDISAALLQDTGWGINNGNAKIQGCDTGVKVINDAGIIIGANVQAYNNTCAAATSTRRGYRACVTGYATRMFNDSLINGTQRDKIVSCAYRLPAGKFR